MELPSNPNQMLTDSVRALLAFVDYGLLVMAWEQVGNYAKA